MDRFAGATRQIKRQRCPFAKRLRVDVHEHYAATVLIVVKDASTVCLTGWARRL
jgi:hypothetical protein